jgi:hypothetical protein
MKNSTKVGMTMVLAILLSFYLSVAFAGNENVNATKSVNLTNATKIMTNTTENITMPQNMTNETKNTSVTINLTNVTMKPKIITTITINATNNTTNVGKQIEYDVRQQIEDLKRDTENMTNTKDNANEIKSALKDP